jgi:hypothetical protein
MAIDGKKIAGPASIGAGVLLALLSIYLVSHSSEVSSAILMMLVNLLTGAALGVGVSMTVWGFV